MKVPLRRCAGNSKGRDAITINGTKKDESMTQEERWKKRYEEVMAFIEINHRNPSKHRIEEHDYLNWLKANRKALNAGKMKEERAEAFKRLMEMMEEYRRKNQWE